MVNCTVVRGEALARFNVTPLIAPVTVLVVLLSGTPSTVRDALVPPIGALKLSPVSLLAMANPPGVPVA